MNPIKTIKKELQDCRAAWAENPTAKFAWCCHHALLIESIGIPEERIVYILSGKPQDEQAVRFRNFRPVRAQLPEEFYKAAAEHHKTWAEYHKTWAEYDKSRAEYEKARAEYEKARAEHDKARDEYVKALDVHQEELERLHLQDWPDTTWNGQSIFAK